MNRVLTLGPIDITAGKYFKPPEPPIILEEIVEDGYPKVTILCKSCNTPKGVSPLYANLVYVAPPNRVAVELEKQLIIFRELSNKNSIKEIEIMAYIGQCVDCQRIYIMKAG